MGLVPGPIEATTLVSIVRAAAALKASYVNLHGSTFTRSKKNRQVLHHLKPEEHQEARLEDLHRSGINLWLAGNCSLSTNTNCGEYVVSQQLGLFEKDAFGEALSLVGGPQNNSLAPRQWEALWVHQFKPLYADSP